MLFIIQLALTIWAAVRHSRTYFLAFILVPIVLAFGIGFFIGVFSTNPYTAVESVTWLALTIDIAYTVFIIWLLSSSKATVNEMFN